MNQRIVAKLRSQAGESIGETLVALLISALALLMLAGAISSAANMVRRSKTAMTAYYENDSSLALVGESSLQGEIAIGDGSLSQTFKIAYNKNEGFGDRVVVSYAVKGD